MRTMVLELAPYNIRVNTVHPTGVATQMVLGRKMAKGVFVPDEENPTEDRLRQSCVRRTRWLSRGVESIDVSNAVLFLASEEATSPVPS